MLAPVPPWTTLALVAVSEKSFGPVTVNAMVALCTSAPLVPVIRMFVVPTGVLVCPLKFTTMVPLPLTDDGLKFALTPCGKLPADMDTLPVKPNNDPTLTVAVGFEFGVNVTAVVTAVTEKSGRPTMVRLMTAVLVIEPLVPVTVRGTAALGTGALAATLTVRMLMPEPPGIVVGLKVAVTPVGKPLTLRPTVPAKLLTGRTVLEVVPLAPCITLSPLPNMVNVGVESEGTTGNEFWMF